MKNIFIPFLLMVLFCNKALALDALKGVGPVSVVPRIANNLQAVISPRSLGLSVSDMLTRCGISTKGSDDNHQLLVRIVGSEFEPGALAFAVLVEYRQPATLWDNKVDWKVATFSELWSGAYPTNEQYILNIVKERVNSFCTAYKKVN